MSPEELVEIRYDPANAAIWLPKVVAAHKAQAAQIEDLMANCNSLRERCWKAEAQIDALKEKLVEERAAVLTCDICYDINKNLAIDGTPTRVDDFTDEEERIKLARQQLKAEMPEVGWE